MPNFATFRIQLKSEKSLYSKAACSDVVSKKAKELAALLEKSEQKKHETIETWLLDNSYFIEERE